MKNSSIEQQKIRGSLSEQYGQNGGPSKLNQLKQLQYFRQMLGKNEDAHLKQILPMYVNRVHTKDLDHQKYVYVPDRNIDQCQAGCAIDASILQLSRKVSLFRMQKKVDQILRTVFWVQLPVLNKLKIMDRFNLLLRSNIQNFAFNRLIYKKGQQFTSIYFIIQGQLKQIQQKSSTPQRILHKHNYISLAQLCNGSQYYHNTMLSNSNTTKLLKIQISQLENNQHEHSNNQKQIHNHNHIKELFITYYQRQQQNHQTLFNKFRIGCLRRTNSNLQVGGRAKGGSQGGSDSYRMSLLEEKSTKQKERDRQKLADQLKLGVFVKKWEQFLRNGAVEDRGFDQFMRSKKMMIQLRQSMNSTRLNRAHNKQKSKVRQEKQQYKYKLQKEEKRIENIQSCRSQLYKQSILKRLEQIKQIQNKKINFNNSQITKVLSQSIFIDSTNNDNRNNTDHNCNHNHNHNHNTNSTQNQHQHQHQHQHRLKNRRLL